MSKYSNTRIWTETVQKLRFIRAHTGEKIVAILERLADEELKRLASDKVNEGSQDSAQSDA